MTNSGRIKFVHELKKGRIYSMKYDIKQIPCQRKDNGKKLYLRRFQCESSYEDKNILCIHGLTPTQHVFDIDYKDYSVARWFCKQGYTVWLLDIGGYGFSEEYENGWDCTTENAAKDIITAAEVINETQHTTQINLMGWSWGSMTTSKAAGMRPDLFRRLVLIAPVTGGGPKPRVSVTEPKAWITLPGIARLFRHTLSGGDEVSTIDNPIEGDEIDYTTADRFVVALEFQEAFTHDCAHPRPEAGTKECLDNPPDAWLIDGTKIKCPTIMVRGTDDVYTTPELYEKLLQQLPEGSDKHTFKGAGHGLYYEMDYYQRFRELVYKFLEK